MAIHCKNCSGTLVFDPEIQKLSCKVCGSTFKPEEAEDTEKDLLADSIRYRDQKIYVCNNCGAEVELNDSESSTICLYCGSPAIAFSRIAKTRCPDKIIPFKVTKQQAMDKLIPYLRTAKFLDNDQRYLWLEKIHGIYVPYWAVTGTDYETFQVIIDDDIANPSNRSYTTIKGRVDANGMPVYGSDRLPFEHLEKIDRWDLGEAVPFDEEYLRGYYSDVTDIDFKTLKKFTERSCFRKLMRKLKMKETDVVDKMCYHNQFFEFTSKPEYLMVPLWFQTVNNRDGSRSTFIMNGQTGECFGSLPAEHKKKFMAIFKNIGLILLFTVPITFFRAATFHAREWDIQIFKWLFFICASILTVAGVIFRKALENNRANTEAAAIATSYSSIRKDK